MAVVSYEYVRDTGDRGLFVLRTDDFVISTGAPNKKKIRKSQSEI
jgi:hypothetical protein